MSKIKNPKFFEIALEVGGSHYPEVGGELLEKFGEAIVRKCAEVADSKEPLNTWSKRYSTAITDHFGIDK
jgi:hypothetical protein